MVLSVEKKIIDNSKVIYEKVKHGNLEFKICVVDKRISHVEIFDSNKPDEKPVILNNTSDSAKMIIEYEGDQYEVTNA